MSGDLQQTPDSVNTRRDVGWPADEMTHSKLTHRGALTILDHDKNLLFASKQQRGRHARARTKHSGARSGVQLGGKRGCDCRWGRMLWANLMSALLQVLIVISAQCGKSANKQEPIAGHSSQLRLQQRQNFRQFVADRNGIDIERQ